MTNRKPAREITTKTGKMRVLKERRSCSRCGEPLDPSQHIVVNRGRVYHKKCWEGLFYEPQAVKEEEQWLPNG